MHDQHFKFRCAALLLTPFAALILPSCYSERPSDTPKNSTAESVTTTEAVTTSAETTEPTDPDKCGSFVGTVYKELNGDIISGAEVTARNVETDETYSAISNLNGLYELTVPKGTYTLHFNAEGYCEFTSDEYKIKKGASVTIDPPAKLVRIGKHPDSDPSSVGPVYVTTADSAAEQSDKPSDTPEQPAVYDDQGDAYSAYINDILARSEYRGFDGKTSDGYATSIDYARFDMNRDGIDELIVNTGSCEADRVISFYTLRDNTVQLIGYNFSGFHVYSYGEDSDSGQFVTEWSHQGYGGATWYFYDGESVQITREEGPSSCPETESPHFIENWSPVDSKCGYKQDSKWFFS